MGLYFDGWAHSNIPNLIETFFTPFHVLLYGGFFLVATLLTATHLRNIARGHGWMQALPQGYFLGLVGIGLFTVGGWVRRRYRSLAQSYTLTASLSVVQSFLPQRLFVRLGYVASRRDPKSSGAISGPH